MKKINFMILVIMVFISLGLSKNFSLSEAINIAKEKDPDLKILKIDLEELKNSITQNKVEILPKINLIAQDTNRSLLESHLVYNNFKFESELVPIKKNDCDFKIIGEQKIIDWAYLTKMGSLKKKYQAELYGYSQKEQDVSYNVVDAYYKLFKAEQIKEITESDVKILENYVKDVKTNLNLNLDTKQSLLNIEINLNNKNQTLYNNKQAYYANKTDFAKILEFPLSLDFQVSSFEALEKIEPKEIPTMTAKELLELALKKRFDVKKLIRLNESIAKEKRSIKRGFLPSFSIEGSYGYLNEGSFSVKDRDNYWSVTLQATFNIFNGRSDKLKIKETNIKLTRNKQELENLKKALELEIEKILYYIDVQTNMYSDAKVGLNTALENLKISTERFGLSQITKDELIGAQLKYSEAKLQYVQTKIDLILSQKKYEYIMGEL